MLDRFRPMRDDPRGVAPLSVILLIAAAVMLGAMFMPFVTQGCIFCALDYTIPARSLINGLDGWIVLVVVTALALSSLAFLTNRRRRSAAVACVALAVSSLVLCLIERVDAAGRVVGLAAAPSPVELGHPGVHLQGFAPPVFTDFGFYVFLVSSMVAVIAALGILVKGRSDPTPDRTTVAIQAG